MGQEAVGEGLVGHSDEGQEAYVGEVGFRFTLVFS